MGRLSDLPRVPPGCAVQWERRQMHDEYHIIRHLCVWYKEIAKFLEKGNYLGRGEFTKGGEFDDGISIQCSTFRCTRRRRDR